MKYCMNMKNGDLISEIIHNRRSIREYKKKKISVNFLNKILDAGRWAPSAHNLQPWKFVVVQNIAIIEEISRIMLKRSNNLLAGFNIVMKESAKCIKKSPCLISVYSTGNILDKFGRLGKPYTEKAELYETQSVSFAIENMMLCAHAIGLGSVCLGIALFSDVEINHLLRQAGKLMTVIAIGFPDQRAGGAKRKSLKEVTEFL